MTITGPGTVPRTDPTPPRTPDDTAVPRCGRGRWRSYRTPLGTEIYVHPETEEQYVRAHPLEHADLIREAAHGLPAWRFVKWEGSSAQRHETRTYQLAAGQTRRQKAKRKP